MLSFVERATTRTFVRVLVIALAAALSCGSFSIKAFAREVHRIPCELPGDGEGVGGYEDCDFKEAPNGGSAEDPIRPPGQHKEQAPRDLCLHPIVLLIHFWLLTPIAGLNGR